MSREARFEIYEDDAGEYRYRLRSANGEIVGPSSQGYRDATDARRGVQDHVETVLAAVEANRAGPWKPKPLVVEIDQAGT